jgi:UDP-N-acetylglucosamine 2-epimerase (non-hydrolysing)
MMKVVTVVGARPNLMKAAPLMRALRQRPEIDAVLIHSGQHYDDGLSAVFFRELDIPDPSVNLGVGSGPHGAQTGLIMQALEPALASLRPDVVVVVGDVNSTMAAALVAAKLRIPVAHVEAGLRSFDRSMPEEINRIVTDAVADYFFTTSREAGEQLAREGAAADRVFFVGNVMIDSMLTSIERARARGTPARYGLTPRSYAVLTLHRPSSVDDARALERIAAAVADIQTRLPIVFPAHPRTRARLDANGLGARIAALPRLTVTPPLGYLDFLGLLADAKLVLTDSGGVQDETTVLGIPCLTLRENTERPVTITHGTNRLVGTDPKRILMGVSDALAVPLRPAERPELWDGRAAERIVDILVEQLSRARSHV